MRPEGPEGTKSAVPRKNEYSGIPKLGVGRMLFECMTLWVEAEKVKHILLEQRSAFAFQKLLCMCKKTLTGRLSRKRKSLALIHRKRIRVGTLAGEPDETTSTLGVLDQEPVCNYAFEVVLRGAVEEMHNVMAWVFATELLEALHQPGVADVLGFLKFH